MRFNTNNYRSIVTEKGIADEAVRKSTGLSEKTFLWILENKYIELSTCELIADAVGCAVGEILLPDSISCDENVIEWTKDQNKATVSLSQRSTITKVEKLAAKHPEECQIVARNKDGSICAHIPVSWVKTNPPREVSEEERTRRSKHMRQLHQNPNN